MIQGYLDDDGARVPFADVRAGKGKFAAPLPLLMSMMAGDADPHDYAAVTASRIAAGLVRQSELLQRHDVYVPWRKQSWSWFGTAVHAVAERESRKLYGDCYHAEVKMTWKHPADVSIGGKPDNIILDGNRLDIDDYKVTKVYTSHAISLRGLNNEKPDWLKQLNLYRWLCEYADDSPWKGMGLMAKSLLRVFAVYKDWAERSECPPIEPFVIPLVGDVAVRGWIDAAVADYLVARDVADDALPPCPVDRLWFNGRTGTVNRCANYCVVAGLCNQWAVARDRARRSPGGQMTMEILGEAAEAIGGTK